MEPNPKARPQRSPRGKRAELSAWIAREQPAIIGEREYAAIQSALAPVSSSHLRRLLRECGAKLTPLVEGVRQDSFESLERTLLALLDEYDRGDSPRRQQLRQWIIESKDRSRLALKRDPQKQEMILWMLTWLENPPLFREWLDLRKRARTT